MSVQQTRRAYVERLAAYLGGRYAVEPAAILSRDKHFVLALARHMIAFKLLSLHWTVTEVGEVMGRDHSTVSHAKGRMARLLRTDSVVRADYYGMPEWGVQSFTEPGLVALYERLDYHVSEADGLRRTINTLIEQQSVPVRNRMSA